MFTYLQNFFSKAIFFLFLLGLLISNSWSESPSDVIPLIAQKFCSNSFQNSYNKKIISISQRIPSNLDWQRSAQLTIPTACHNNFNSWLAGLAFNLNLFAIEKNISAQVIEETTPFLNIRTFGKDEYLELTKVWQDAIKTSYEEEKLRDLFSYALKKEYRAAAIYGVTTFYYQFILQKIDHEQAKQQAVQKFIGYKNIQNFPFIEKKTAEMLCDNTKEELWSKIKKRNLDEIVSLKKKFSFSQKSDSKKRRSKKNKKSKKAIIQEEKEALAEVAFQEHLQKLANSWLKVPYRYGGNSRRGIDSASFVSKLISELLGHSDTLLPRSVSWFSDLGKEITFAELKTGDLVFLSYSYKKYPTHVAVYLGNAKIIFADNQRGVISVNIENSFIKNKIISIRRIMP